jgi:hypothetical protein
MKIFYSIVIVLTFIAVSFSAQQQKKSLGIKIGPYFSTIRYYAKTDNDSKTTTFETGTSPAVSFYLDLPHNKTITHSFALSYYQNRGEETNSVFFLSRTRTIALQYLGMGYTFKANAQFERFTPFLAAGLTFDFLLNYNREGFNDVFAIQEDDVDHFSARFILGGGVEYSFDRVSILMEYGFSYNLIPFYSYKNDDLPLKYNYTAYGSTLSFGVKIPF